MRVVHLLLFLILLGVFSCSEEEKKNVISESVISTGSPATVFESISLGIAQDTFRRSLAKMADIQNDDLNRRIPCTALSEVPVLDPGAGTVTERVSGGHALTSCTLLQAGLHKSWEVASVAGWSVDGVLSRVTWRVKKDLLRPISDRLKARFGTGAAMTVTASSLIGRSTVAVTVWRVKGEVWAVERHPNDVAITRQSDGVYAALPLRDATPEKGKPVPLDDIGLGGPIQINLDDIEVPATKDTSADSSAPAH